MPKQFTLGILGAGFSGKMLASKLLSNSEFAAKSKIYLIDPTITNGVAYGTPDMGHLLNVRVSNMSALADRPTHFLDYLNTEFGDKNWASQFVSRKIYSEYLDYIFSAATALAPDSIEIVKAEVKNVLKKDGRLEVLTTDQALSLDHLVLAYGNIHLDNIPTATGPVAAKAAWPFNAQALSKDKILFVGTSLTMVDLALSAARLNPDCKLVAVSRNGLLPAVHATTSADQIIAIREIFDTQFGSDPVSLRELLSFLRGLSTMHSWREVVDALRPQTTRLWKSFCFKEKQFFNRRLSTFWSVHRHRVSPEVSSQLEELISTSQLRIIPGKILSAEKTEFGFNLIIQDSNRERLTLNVDEVFNCTGPASIKQLAMQPLIASLLNQQLIAADKLGVGLSLENSVDPEVLFTSQISSLGPPIRGELLECTAVPELRIQVERLAKLLQR